jgi:hypothetical protein
MMEKGVTKVVVVDDSTIAGKRLIAILCEPAKAGDTSYARHTPQAHRVCSEGGSRCGAATFADAHLIRPRSC